MSTPRESHVTTPSNASAPVPESASVSPSRNSGLDILKIICSFLVVYIHTSWPGKVGDAIYMIARIAVPIFFIITGFFYSDTLKRGKVFLQIKKILRLFLIANAIFLLYELALALIPDMDIQGFFTTCFSKQAIIDFLFFNVSPFGLHLWYLGAILYTLLIMALLYKQKTKKILWAFIPVLLAVDLILGDYSVIIWGRTFPHYYVRNFACVGIPYFLIGTMLQEYLPRIKEKFSAKFFGFCALFFVLLTITERFLLTAINVAGIRKHNISTTLLAISVFLFFLLFFENKKENRLTLLATTISRKHSAWIYILHLLFIPVFGVIAKILNISALYTYAKWGIVYVGTTIFLVIVDFLYQRLRQKRTH